ncbi:hypothetical protein HNW13_018245 [Shewanella sp. BF02_Schw]|uniref:hypothetical protein n=1 Tax=Shewanella sp. BF02_Schw TaxID=394908 RepID=UPI00177BFFC3|nr:hypothetical protein [Shewanella sp. BF02_Schw]MBO1897682.1 hypothetical protein [Shewanella sp. BF02_Schw]
MNIRRKLLGMMFGGILGTMLSVYSKKAEANLDEDLFEYALQYIAEIIITYYGNTWYQNTQDQIGEWGQNNGEKTIEEENTLRVDFAKFGDAINATSKEVANKELMADTEPTPLNCTGGQLNELRNYGVTNTKSQTQARATLRNTEIKNFSSGTPQTDQFDVDLSTDAEILALSSSINDAVNLLMNGSGYTSEELTKIDVFFNASLPQIPEINLNGEGFKADRSNAKKATQIAQINTAKVALDYLISKRTKFNVPTLDAGLNEVSRNYRKEQGLSDFEILQMNVDLYTKNKELNSKLNGESGFVSFVPVGIVLSEIKSIENKILLDINEVDNTITKLLAIQSLSELSS